MLRLERDQDQFKLFFKEFEFLRHSNKNPCVEIGTGQEDYRMNEKHCDFTDLKIITGKCRSLKNSNL